MQRLELGGLRFKRPLEINPQELFSVLDCYNVQPVGNWPVQPELMAPLSQYQACSDLASYLQLGEDQTIWQYLFHSVSDVTARGFLEKILLED